MSSPAIQNHSVTLSPKTFAIIKSNKSDLNAFVNIIDLDQTTLIIDQKQYTDEEVIEKSLDWRMFSLNVDSEIGAVEVTAQITVAFTKAGIKTMSINAYARDHFLVSSNSIDQATTVLKDLGLKIVKK